MFVFVWAQGCSESSVGVAADPRTDVAVWSFSAVFYRHGLPLHPPQLPTGTHSHLCSQEHTLQMFPHRSQ